MGASGGGWRLIPTGLPGGGGPTGSEESSGAWWTSPYVSSTGPWASVAQAQRFSRRLWGLDSSSGSRPHIRGPASASGPGAGWSGVPLASPLSHVPQATVWSDGGCGRQPVTAADACARSSPASVSAHRAPSCLTASSASPRPSAATLWSAVRSVTAQGPGSRSSRTPPVTWTAASASESWGWGVPIAAGRPGSGAAFPPAVSPEPMPTRACALCSGVLSPSVLGVGGHFSMRAPGGGGSLL